VISDPKARVYLLGGRLSSVVAQYASYQLTTLRGEVHCFAPLASGVREDRIADFTRKDVLVAYDFRRYQPETIAFCQTARELGLRVVLFTDQDLSPIADVADVVIPVTVETTTPMDTLVVAIAATDALLARVVKVQGPQVSKRMARLESLRRKASDPNLH
jgi:DNA-binding MurR/RpiR family transcriptional regulator